MARGGSFIGGLAVLVLMMPTASAVGETSASYAFSWAGLDVGRFELVLADDGGSYRARWTAGTTGLIGTLFPFAAQGSATGRRAGASFLPDRYDGRSDWRDGGSWWRVVFAGDGRAAQIEVAAEEQAEREPVPPELRVGPDPASLALSAIAQAAPGLRLDGRSFDGRRAAAFAVACGAVEPTSAELPCSIASRLVAGGSRAWRERPPSEADSKPLQVWLRTGVHGDGWWPVRLEASSRFGTVAARLISIEELPAAG